MALRKHCFGCCWSSTQQIVFTFCHALLWITNIQELLSLWSGCCLTDRISMILSDMHLVSLSTVSGREKDSPYRRQYLGRAVGEPDSGFTWLLWTAGYWRQAIGNAILRVIIFFAVCVIIFPVSCDSLFSTLNLTIVVSSLLETVLRHGTSYKGERVWPSFVFLSFHSIFD